MATDTAIAADADDAAKLADAIAAVAAERDPAFTRAATAAMNAANRQQAAELPPAAVGTAASEATAIVTAEPTAEPEAAPEAQQQPFVPFLGCAPDAVGAQEAAIRAADGDG